MNNTLLTCLKLFIFLLFTMGCSPKVVQSPPSEKQEPIVLTKIEDIAISVVKLPELKDSIYFKERNETGLNSVKEDDLIPDEYGTFFNDYRSIPIYDINNLPISVWFFKRDRKHVGFMIAGHATKAVCEIASLEVHNKLKEIGTSTSSIFSYGIGYDLLEGEDSSNHYNSTMKTMKDEFQTLGIKNRDQVKVYEIDYNKYIEYLNLIKYHIVLANKSKTWNTHIVEYKLDDFPLIAPFYYTKTAKEISFEVPKKLFGSIPTELVYASYQKNLVDVENALKEKIKFNKEEIEKISAYRNRDDRSSIWEIAYWSLDKNELYLNEKMLWGYRPPPEGYKLCNTSTQFGLPDCRPITFKEALIYLKDPDVEKTPQVISELTKWRIKAEEDLKSFKSRKEEIITKISLEERDIKEFLVTVENRKKDLLNRDNQDYIIDAFLRGWAFNTNDTLLNTQLDNWYTKNRKLVWDNILDKIPNSRINNNLGGIFHSDDVFFQIESKVNTFKITPYKVVGGEFIQVIDKQIGISYLQSPFNYRLSLN